MSFYKKYWTHHRFLKKAWQRLLLRAPGRSDDTATGSRPEHRLKINRTHHKRKYVYDVSRFSRKARQKLLLRAPGRSDDTATGSRPTARIKNELFFDALKGSQISEKPFSLKSSKHIKITHLVYEASHKDVYRRGDQWSPLQNPAEILFSLPICVIMGLAKSLPLHKGAFGHARATLWVWALHDAGVTCNTVIQRRNLR